jgi:hypothetical protein
MLKQSLKYPKQVGLLVVAAMIGLLAARPLFVPRLPHGTDTLTHFYTLIQLNHLLQQGIFYSRWLPYRASGFGVPLFQYYTPLAYYVAEGFSLLGLEALLALRLAWGLALVGGALGMYLWLRDTLDEGSALVAVATYICGPYVLFNTYFRGGFAEQFALMLMPFVLWAFRRLAIAGQARYLTVSALTYAALILTHNVTAFIFSAVLLAYTIVLTGAGLPPAALKTRRNVLMTLLLAIGLGLGLSAFFWLPALIELDSIVATDLYTAPGLDYHQHFLPLTALLVTPLTTTIRPGLSVVALGLGVIGLLHVWQDNWTRKRRLSFYTGKGDSGFETPELWFSQTLCWQSGFAALIAIGCIMMVLPFLVWLWEIIPQLRFFQFPQRFLGVASLFVAFLSGVGAYSLSRWLNNGYITSKRVPLETGLLTTIRQRPALMLFVIIGLLASHTWGLVQVRYYPPLPAIDVYFIMQKERELGLGNTVYIGNFVPTTVKTMPPVEQLAHDGPERLDLASLPAEATLIAASYSPLRYDLTLSSPKPFSARFNTFYFPGWSAQLDGETAPVSPTDPYGLISVEVPAGQHHLVVWFGSTPIRTLANILTASSAVILGLAMITMWLRNSKKEND